MSADRFSQSGQKLHHTVGDAGFHEEAMSWLRSLIARQALGNNCIAGNDSRCRHAASIARESSRVRSQPNTPCLIAEVVHFTGILHKPWLIEPEHFATVIFKKVDGLYHVSVRLSPRLTY